MMLLNPDAGNILPGKEKWLLMLSAIFLTTLFLPKAPVINNIALIALVLMCWAFNSWKEKIRLFRQRPAIIFIILFYLFQVVSTLMSDDHSRGFRFIEMRIPLLLFPISLGLIYLRPALKFRMFLLYSVTITFAALYCLVTAMMVYARTGDSGFIYNDSLTDGINKQSVYFALMVNVAIFSYCYLLTKKILAPAIKRIAVASVAFLMIIHFLLASRMEISFLYSTVIVFALYYFFITKRNTRAGLMMVGGLVICGIIFMQLFPKTINRFNELMYPDFNFSSEAAESHYNGKLSADQWNGFNIRLAIWTCGSELIATHPFSGVGLGDKDQALLDVYAEKDFKFGIRTNKNMHSTYLDLLASMGIIGFSLFAMGFLVLPMLTSIRSRDFAGMLIMIDFMLSFVTETYPDRSMGCVIFGFFIAFIISYKDKSAAVS